MSKYAHRYGVTICFLYLIRQIVNDFRNKTKILLRFKHLKQSNSTLYSYESIDLGSTIWKCLPEYFVRH